LTQYSGFAFVYHEPHERMLIWSGGSCNRWTPRNYKYCYSQFILIKKEQLHLFCPKPISLLYFSLLQKSVGVFILFLGNESLSEQRSNSSSWVGCGELSREFLPLEEEIILRSGRRTNHLSF